MKYFLVRGRRQKTKSFALLRNYFSHSVDSKSPLLTQIATLSERALSWINIEELYLDNNKLTDTHILQLESIRFCTKLKKLSLSLNFISDKGALQLANVPLKKLEVLDLWGNFIKKYKTAILLMKNTNWGSLKTLCLYYTGWAKEKQLAVQSLQQKESSRWQYMFTFTSDFFESP